MGRFKIACHLIQWQEERGNPEKALKEVADAGYEGVEGLGARSPEDFVKIGAIAGKLGLHIISMGGGNIENRFKFNLALGNNFAEIHALEKQAFGGSPGGGNPMSGKRLKEEDYKRAAESIKDLCALAKSYNIKPVHHAHLGTMIETTEDAELMLRYAPDLYLLFDTGHLTAANSDPMDILESHGDRIAHVHLKDVRAKDPEIWKRGEGRFSPEPYEEDIWFEELGRGNFGLDIARILKGLENIGYDGWISVEQDRVTAHTPEETAKVNRMYLKSLGY